MRPIRCLSCGGARVQVDVLFCSNCRRTRTLIELGDIARRHQQYRILVSARLNNSVRWTKRVRAAARSAKVEPISGPMGIRVIAQRSEWDKGPVMAGHFVYESLKGLAVGEDSELTSFSVTLLKGGELLTVVEIRGLFDEELAGQGGWGR